MSYKGHQSYSWEEAESAVTQTAASVPHQTCHPQTWLTLHAALSLSDNAQGKEPASKLKKKQTKKNKPCIGKSEGRVRAYLDLLLEDLMVLFLLVQHMLLLSLLQGPLIHLPPIHLLQLLALLKGKQRGQTGHGQVYPMP